MGRVLLFLFVVFAGNVLGQSLPEPSKSGSRIVSDFAGVMDSYQEASIHKKLDQFYRESSTEIAVVTVKTTGDLTAQQFALKLAEKWEIGRKGQDNGVLVFAAIDDRKIRIEVGEGLEGAIPDAYAKRIIENVMVPQFKEGRYGQGFDEATDILMALCKGEYEFSEKEHKGEGLPIWVIIIVIIILILLFRKGGGDGITYDDRKTHRRSIFPTTWIGGGGFTGGGGGGGFSGGGFGGGFGGGSFGGGGAGGSW